jgi:hypothetical protein
VVDGFAPISWLAAVVPFTSPYRPLWLGLGALAFDLILALVVTSLLRSHLSYRAWKTVHWAAYACWPIAFVHGLGTGSDGTARWALVIDALCLAAVVAAIGWRVVEAGWMPARRRLLVGAATGLTLVVVVAWALTGPAQPGWARRAGTPESLLGAATTDTTPDQPPASGGSIGGSGASTSTSTTAPVSLSVPFTAPLQGTLAETGDGQAATVTIDGTFTAGVSGTVHVELDGRAAPGGGLRLRSGTVTVGTAAQPKLGTGAVTNLDGAQITATVSIAGSPTTIVVDLDSGEVGPVTGTISASGGTRGPAR